MNWRNRTVWYLLVVVCIGMLALWGCPKKTQVSVVPQTPPEEKPAAAAIVQPEQKAEAAKPEAAKVEQVEPREPAAAASVPAGLRPVYFNFDRAIIEAEAGEIMKANAEWLKAHPQITVKIEGNCDERGTREYNQTLGQRRAANAKKYLTDMGISGKRISLISYGKEKLSCTDSTESCWQKSRRDDFAVASD